MAQAATPRRVVHFGVYELDFGTGELRKGGLKIKLQGQPFQVLKILLESPGELVTREELRSRLWPSGTFVDFDHGLNVAVKKVRRVLSDSAENPRFIETLSRRGYRFVASVENVPTKESEGRSEVLAESVASLEPVHGSQQRFLPRAVGLKPGLESGYRSAASSGTVVIDKAPAAWGAKFWKIAVPVLTVALVTGGGLYYRSHQSKPLTDRDTIVLSDFSNSTGDAVFDDTLKQGLSVQLEQSPFLSLVSDRRVNDTLRLMGDPPGSV